MGARRNRAFHYAVLLSIVVHAAVLFTAPALREASRRMAWPEPIVARLVEPPAPPAPDPVVPPRNEKPQPSVAKPAVKPVLKPVPPTQPAPVAKAAPEAPPQPEPAAPAAVPAPATPAPPAPPARVARPGADVDAVGHYRMLVIEEARKLKRYPRAARDNNWEGRTNVRVNVGPDGGRAGVAVVRSSGHEVLDREALDTVTRAEVPLPAGLRGKEFAFEIEVVFNLRE